MWEGLNSHLVSKSVRKFKFPKVHFPQSFPTTQSSPSHNHNLHQQSSRLLFDFLIKAEIEARGWILKIIKVSI
jgi:hypothetical protein